MGIATLALETVPLHLGRPASEISQYTLAVRDTRKVNFTQPLGVQAKLMMLPSITTPNLLFYR